MVAVHAQHATRAISARSDVGGPFIDFVHCTVYHKSTWVANSCSEQYILNDSNCSALPLLLDPRPLISAAWTRG